MSPLARLGVLAVALVATPAAAQTGTGSNAADPVNTTNRPTTDGTTTTYPDGTQTRADQPAPTPAGTPQSAAGANRDGMMAPMDMNARFTGIDRDLSGLRQSPDYTRFQQERDALRRESDALGTTATAEQRRTLAGRIDTYEANLRAARMGTASRADFFRMADARMADTDRQIDALRARMMQAQGDRRAEIAADLIALRRQQDAYRTETFRLRGAGARGYEDARAGAVSNLSRLDAQFREAYGAADMRAMGMGQPGAAPGATSPGR